MILNNSYNLVNKITAINKALSCKEYDFYEDIGFVKDLFTSPYNNSVVAEPNVIKDLWLVLFRVFCHDTSYDNKFDAIFAMSDISLYANQREIDIDRSVLKKWRIECNQNDITSEVLEIIDDILAV